MGLRLWCAGVDALGPIACKEGFCEVSGFPILSVEFRAGEGAILIIWYLVLLSQRKQVKRVTHEKERCCRDVKKVAPQNNGKQKEREKGRKRVGPERGGKQGPGER